MRNGMDLLMHPTPRTFVDPAPAITIVNTITNAGLREDTDRDPDLEDDRCLQQQRSVQSNGDSGGHYATRHYLRWSKNHRMRNGMDL